MRRKNKHGFPVTDYKLFLVQSKEIYDEGAHLLSSKHYISMLYMIVMAMTITRKDVNVHTYVEESKEGKLTSSKEDWFL